MKPEQLNTNTNQEPSHIRPITKYFALILFILLPFIGGWIGYSFVSDTESIEVTETLLNESAYENGDRIVTKSGVDVYSSIQNAYNKKSNSSLGSQTFDVIGTNSQNIIGTNNLVWVDFDIGTSGFVYETFLEDESIFFEKRARLDQVRVNLEESGYPHFLQEIRVDGKSLSLYSKDQIDSQELPSTSSACYFPEVEYQETEVALLFNNQVFPLGSIGIPKKYNDEWQLLKNQDLLQFTTCPSEGLEVGCDINERPVTATVTPMYSLGKNYFAVLNMSESIGDSPVNNYSDRIESVKECFEPNWELLFFRSTWDSLEIIPHSYEPSVDYDIDYDSFRRIQIHQEPEKVWSSICSVSGCG